MLTKAYRIGEAYVLRRLPPKTRRTAYERRHRRRSTDQAFWRRQTGFDTAHLLLYCKPTVHRAFHRGGMETNCLQFRSGGKLPPSLPHL